MLALSSKNTRLSGMMFLQYAIWGAWLPVTARYLSATIEEGGLGFSGSQIGMILGLAGSIGAIASPFIAGQISDRYFNTERIAFLVISGGVIKMDYGLVNRLHGVADIIYNLQCFIHAYPCFIKLDYFLINNQEMIFLKLELGYDYWIASSWLFPMIWLQTNLDFQLLPPFVVGSEVSNVTSRLADALKFSGIISIIYGIYCYLLPQTPPKRMLSKILLLKRHFDYFVPSFFVLVISSLLISVIHQIYFLQTGPFLSHIGVLDSQIGPAMTIGQFAEIITMAYLGMFLKRLGFHRLITIGILAYAMRYAIFGTVFLPVWIIVLSQGLHGFCYAFFFAAAYIYVDKISDHDVRHSAQTVFGIIILGGGPVIGGWLSGFLQLNYTNEGVFDFSIFWYTLSAIGLITAIIFFFLFEEEHENIKEIQI